MKRTLLISIFFSFLFQHCLAQSDDSENSIFRFQANYRQSFAATKFQQYIPEALINVGSFEMTARYNALLLEQFSEKKSFSTFDFQFVGCTTPYGRPLRFTFSFGILTQPNKRVQPELASSVLFTTNSGSLQCVIKGRATTFSPYDGRTEMTVDISHIISGSFMKKKSVSLGLSGLISNYRIDGKSIPVETVGVIMKHTF